MDHLFKDRVDSDQPIKPLTDNFSLEAGNPEDIQRRKDRDVTRKFRQGVKQAGGERCDIYITDPDTIKAANDIVQTRVTALPSTGRTTGGRKRVGLGVRMLAEIGGSVWPHVVSIVKESDADNNDEAMAQIHDALEIMSEIHPRYQELIEERGLTAEDARKWIFSIIDANLATLPRQDKRHD